MCEFFGCDYCVLLTINMLCHVEVMFIQLLNLLERYYVYLHLCLLCVCRTPSQLHSLHQIPTQHDMLPQHLVYKNELNREYVITLARNDETP